MPETSLREKESFAIKFAQLRKEYGEDGKQTLEKIYQECLANDTYAPRNDDLTTLVSKLGFSGTTYPCRDRGENNRSYALRLHQFLSLENTTSKTTNTKIAGAVAGILEE